MVLQNDLVLGHADGLLGLYSDTGDQGGVLISKGWFFNNIRVIRVSCSETQLSKPKSYRAITGDPFFVASPD